MKRPCSLCGRTDWPNPDSGCPLCRPDGEDDDPLCDGDEDTTIGCDDAKGVDAGPGDGLNERPSEPNTNKHDTGTSH